MATPFTIIYDKFLSQIDESAKILKLPIEDLEELMYGYLENSIVDFKKCKKDLMKNINKTLKQFDVDLDVEEVYILSLGMVLHWVQPKLQRENILRQSLGDRDYKLSSNWQTLNQLLELEAKIRKTLDKKIVSYTYNSLNLL